MLLRSKKHNCWIKEDPKWGIFGNFSKTLRPWKSLYICQWSLFWIKKKVCLFLMHLRFKKKTVLKHLDRTVYIITWAVLILADHSGCLIIVIMGLNPAANMDVCLLCK
jgi:hypothetical protein